jgi:hypothetical protein
MRDALMLSSRMTVMKMTPEEFSAWSQRLQFTADLLEKADW